MSKKLNSLLAQREALEKAIAAEKATEKKRKRESIIRIAERAGVFDLDEQFLVQEFKRLAEAGKQSAQPAQEAGHEVHRDPA